MNNNPCPHTRKKDCPMCGPWLGWIDLRNPRRRPTDAEWIKCCEEAQSRHDEMRAIEYSKLAIVEPGR